jgi:hypothetical protein
MIPIYLSQFLVLRITMHFHAILLDMYLFPSQFNDSHLPFPIFGALDNNTLPCHFFGRIHSLSDYFCLISKIVSSQVIQELNGIIILFLNYFQLNAIFVSLIIPFLIFLCLISKLLHLNPSAFNFCIP